MVPYYDIFFFFNDTATTEIYTLSLHDALPISIKHLIRLTNAKLVFPNFEKAPYATYKEVYPKLAKAYKDFCLRSEEHTSELQSRQYLVCRLLLEKKKKS